MADNPFNFLEENTGGEPIKGQAPKLDDFSAAFQQLNAESEQQRQLASAPPSFGERLRAPVGPTEFTYVPSQSVDPYRYQKGFQNEFFNPLDSTNYQKFADRETFGSALSKGFDSFKHKFGNTFVDYWKGYGRMADALVHMDWDRMKPDEETLATQYYQDQLDMNRNFVFEQPENEDSIFNKRTMSEFIGNAGFALGTFAGLTIEIAADMAVTALSGGAGAVSFGATAARLAAREAASTAARSGYKFADALTDVAKGFSYGNKSVDELSAAAKVANKIDEAAAIGSATRTAARDAMSETFTIFSNNFFNIAKSKNLTEMGANLLKGTPLLGTAIRSGEKLAAASRAGANTGQLIGVGLQGLRRVAQELNMSGTEASFEAVTSYGDTLDKMVKQYQSDNQGAAPSAEEFETMRSLALEASSANYNTNMALLLATNKLQFGNLFNRFIPANKFMTEAVENAMVINSKAGRGLIDTSGFFGSYGVLGKVAKEFGKKEAAWQFSKAFAKDFARFELSEGLQENLQETSAAAWRDYYAGQFNGMETSLENAFGKGLSEQFTKQGLKTFLMGAFTGSLIRVPTALASKSLEAANRAVINREYAKNPEANPLKRAEAQFKKDLEVQNALFKQAKEGKFKDKVFNFVAQMDAAQEQSEAAAKGLRYEFENGRDNALLAAVASAQRTNSIGVLQKAVAEMGKDMSAEEFEKSFGIKLEDTKYNSASEFSQAVAKDIKKYADVIDGLRTKFKSSIADPTRFAAGSRNQYVAMMMRSSQEDAIQVIAMNAIKGDMTANRAKQIAEELLSVPGISSSADFALRSLTNSITLSAEIKTVFAEIEVLKENLQAEGIDSETKAQLKQQLTNKLEEQKLLKKWEGYWEMRETVIGVDKDNNEVKGKGIADVFIGKVIDKKQTVTDENGNEVETVDRTYDPTDSEVIETFRQLMNIKNKQAGNATELSEESMRDGFQKIYDYMRLDRDTKDYMRSMDVLMNPDNYRKMVERMTDGKFKFNIIIHIDQIVRIVYENISLLVDELNIANEADVTSIVEEMSNLVYKGENFKNLSAIVSNPDAGIEMEEYAYKLFNAITEDVAKKAAEIRVKFAPREYSNDITQEDYDEIIATGELDPVIKFLIAAKKSRGVALSELEDKVYQIHKEAIDKEVVKTETPVETTTAVDPAQVSTEASPEVIPVVGPDGEIVKQTTPVPTDATTADIERRRQEAKNSLWERTKLEEALLRDKKELERTGRVDNRASSALRQMLKNKEDEIDKEYDNIILKEFGELEYKKTKILREKKNLEEYFSKSPTTDYMELENRKRRLAKYDEELAALEQPAAASAAPVSVAVVSDEGEAAIPSNIGPIMTFLGIESPAQETDQQTPFAATGTPETGFDVVDRGNNTVNPEKIPSEQTAVELAESLNTTRADLEFIERLMGPRLEPGDTQMLAKVHEIFQKSMQLYNKRKGTTFTTLEEYYKTPDGKRLLDANLESVLTGKPVNYKQKPEAVAITPVTTEVSLFDTPSSGNVASLTLSSLESLHAKVKEFRQQALQESDKFSKFVETGNVPSAPVTETSILDKLQDITRCFS